MKVLVNIAFLLIVSTCFTRKGSESASLKEAGSLPSIQNLREYSLESSEEKQFKKLLAKELLEKDVRVCYHIGNLSYILEHLIPLYHVYPSPLCGVRDDELVVKNKQILMERGFEEKDFFLFENLEEMEGFVKNSKNLMVTCSGTKIKAQYPNLVNIGHGVDQDGLYHAGFMKYTPGKTIADDISLLFSKFNESNYPSKAEIAEYYKLDPSKKTVVVLSTQGFFEFFDEFAPAHVSDSFFKSLQKLGEEYNLIIRPHPLIHKDFLGTYKRYFIVAPQGVFPYFVSLYDSADLVIGTPGAGGNTATSRPQIPLVILRPHKLYMPNNPLDLDAVSKKYNDIVLNENKVVLQQDDNIDLVARAHEALNDPKAEIRIKNRKEHFKSWFGCIDGYEEYRVFLVNLLQGRVNTSPLREIYTRFPSYSGRPNCLAGK